ncbi:hypothetical protein EG327_001696 [Venturia inaequalis]|uniref:IBR domain-containing protein n=1 Tax=Venturia inaequalis TaxID=5025 RepID=A0A8H3VM74_VENIN|nr:hypothetical protein EG327_001696 [Venturia inaequalis]
MAITKKALRKQAARERKAARKTQEQQFNASLTELNDQDPEPGSGPDDVPPSLRRGDGDDIVGPKDEAIISHTPGGGSSTTLDDNAPPNALDVEAAIDAVLDEANASEIVPEPPTALEDPFVSRALVAAGIPAIENAPIAVEALLAVPGEESVSTNDEHPTPLFRQAPEASEIPIALEAPDTPPTPIVAAPPLAVPVTSKKPTRVHPPPVDAPGPSYSRRDPFTGVLAEDPDQDISKDGPTTVVSDEIVAQAVHVDAPIIAELALEEIIAEEDHRMAVELDGGRTQPAAETAPRMPASGITIAPMKSTAGINPTATPIFAPTEPITRGFQSEDAPVMVALAIAQMAALRKKRNASFEDADESDTTSHKTYTEVQSDAIHKLPRRAFECTICADMFRKHEIIQLDCTNKHLYCPACLKETFIQASSDIAAFPPRCCDGSVIPVSLVSNDMSPREMEDYTDTQVEIKTDKKFYCSHDRCGKFIPPTNIDADHATCTRCGTITCIHCKLKQHPEGCLQDLALQSTLALARTEGWKQCFACSHMVELNHGCYHMVSAISVVSNGSPVHVRNSKSIGLLLADRYASTLVTRKLLQHRFTSASRAEIMSNESRGTYGFDASLPAELYLHLRASRSLAALDWHVRGLVDFGL